LECVCEVSSASFFVECALANAHGFLDGDDIVPVAIQASYPESGRAAGTTTLRLRLQPGGRPSPVVLLVHGVGGSAGSSYVRRGAHAFFDAGYHTARLNLRGAAESVYGAPDLYHMGLCDDLLAAVTNLSARPDTGDIFVVGYSGGAALVVKAAAHWSKGHGERTKSRVRKVAALATPIDLTEVRRNIERTRNLPYQMHVLRGLHRCARRFALRKGRHSPISLVDIARSVTVREFDTRITIRMHNFESVESYDALSSASLDMPNVNIPTLMLHAKDDPMVPVRALERALENAPACFSFAISDHGGHLGWAHGTNEEGLTQTWAVKRVLHFFQK
jgi:uncharacterized protein